MAVLDIVAMVLDFITMFIVVFGVRAVKRQFRLNRRKQAQLTAVSRSVRRVS
jgi:hypothetical protein